MEAYGGGAMEGNLSVKNLVGRTERDPWSAVIGSRLETYRIPEVGVALMERVDHALFERDLDRAITAGVIFQKWAEHDLHFRCKAPAVMAAVYAVCGLSGEAERMLVAAKKRLPVSNCQDCRAQYLRRTGTFCAHEGRYQNAYSAYSQSSELFLELGDRREAGISVLSRGTMAFLLHRCDKALEDHNFALELLGEEFSIHLIIASINIAAIHADLGQAEHALQQIHIAQAMLKGQCNAERPRLILRWIRALLFEAEGKNKDAGEILDRVEARMRRHDMKPELRVLLADRARIARRPSAIRRIARKAHTMEEIPRIKSIIESVMKKPTRENILSWREALDSYVSPFPATT